MFTNRHPLSISPSQTQCLPSRKQMGRNASSKQCNVCSAAFSSKANWESPVKLLELFPNANMCYQINKATKDANREIRVARLASVGRKKKWNISIKALPRVFSAESEENRFVCFCLKIWVWVFTRNRGPPGSMGIQRAFGFWNSPIFCWVSKSPSLQCVKRGWEQGEISEPRWWIHPCS